MLESILLGNFCKRFRRYPIGGFRESTVLARAVPSGVAIALSLVLVLIAGSWANAQVLYGTVAGTVTDSTGAVVAKADIKAVNLATGLVLTSVSNGDGTYSVSNMLPGSYNVTIAASGFSTFEAQAVPVTVNTTVRVNATLKVGPASQNITVSAGELPLLQTDRADIRYDISEKQVRELPTSSTAGRNIGSLFILVPGSTPPAENNSMAANPQRSMTVNVNGLNDTTNTTRIDGAIDTFPWLPQDGAAYVPPQDAVESVNIITGSFTAEQGGAGASATNIVIKSGTNHFHGSAYEYNGIKQYNARTYFNTPAVQPRITASGNSLNAPGNSQTADQLVQHVQILGGHGPGHPYFNTADFAQPTGARFGTGGRNNVRGPGTFNLNAGIKRTIPLREGIALQIQAEAFDVTNTPQFGNPGSNVSSGSSFGIINGLQPNSNRTRV